MKITRRSAVGLLAGAPALILPRKTAAQDALPEIQKGPFDGTAESLKKYQIPEWFRDAKFGMWAHWGPQSAAEDGDWYARNIYIPTQAQYKDHLQTYGHPSKFGHKDICFLWKGDKFDPDHLMSLYKKAGAKYFMSMGVHHDNFDLWNSKYQPRWNSVATGPKKDIVGLWKKAAQKAGVKFAVSEHLSNSYNWLAVSHGADKEGPMAGVPYDGNDPQYADLYHPFGPLGATPPGAMSREVPDAWKRQYFLRIKDLIDNYQPDLLYTDGGIPFGDAGNKLVSHYYNVIAKLHGGKVEGVYTSKRREDCVEGTCALDIERGVANQIMPNPWQTDTCIGNWHYKRGVKYKTPKVVIDLLCDIVSRNGNLMLNIPLPNSGEPDAEELRIVDEITRWMAVNSEGIYSTRPWKTFGDGPGMDSAAGTGMNERNRKDLTAQDVRFTTKNGSLYAFVMGWPEKEAVVPALALGGKNNAGTIKNVELLGHKGKIKFTQDATALRVELPSEKPSDHAITLKIAGA
ncbi:MAG: alpha-L-fucosidase [Acidobacteriia bacterium]|nr:alpha-L-fucosidase [Terriglobia bacterium]